MLPVLAPPSRGRALTLSDPELVVDVRRAPPSAPSMWTDRVADGRLWRVDGGAITLARPAVPDSGFGLGVLVQLRGQASLEIAGRRADLGPGDVTLLSDALPSVMEAETEVSQVAIEIPHAACVSLRPADIVGRTHEGADPLVPVLAAAVGALWHRGAPDPVRDAAALGAVAALVRAVAAPWQRADALAERALERVTRDLADPDLSARRLADGLGVSRRHLDARLADSTSRTADAWIRERRLLHASRLLADGGARTLGIYGVALECGFTDAAHFSRAFRRRFGCPPSAWNVDRPETN